MTETQNAIVLVVAGLIVIGLLVGLFRILGDTKRRSGKWGANFRRVTCPSCESELPAVRLPRNLRQVLWGGWTCRKCGEEVDKWGKVLE